jgi:glycosyltransferase involved in cell wall biosynthesis
VFVPLNSSFRSEEEILPRVLHVAETVTGGVASYFDEFLPYQNALYGAENIRLVVPAEQAGHIAAAHDGQIVTFKRNKRSLLAILRCWYSLQLVILRWRPDIVHAHSSFAGFAARLSPLIFLRRCRLIYCAHGWSFLMDQPGWRKPLFRLTERCLCLWTDAVINISNFEMQGALAAGLQPKKLRVIRSGIAADLSERAASGEPTPYVPVPDNDTINLLFVGRMDETKGFDLLLRSMVLLENSPVRLVVCGAPVYAEMPSNFPPNIEYLGWVDRDRLAAVYGEVDAVVVPSRAEGLGFAALEAMRSKKAVIASIHGALPEVVLDGITGLLFDPLDETALKTLLDRTDRSALSDLGIAGYQRFKEFFTAERMNREIAQLYQELLGS